MSKSLIDKWIYCKECNFPIGQILSREAGIMYLCGFYKDLSEKKPLLKLTSIDYIRTNGIFETKEDVERYIKENK